MEKPAFSSNNRSRSGSGILLVTSGMLIGAGLVLVFVVFPKKYQPTTTNSTTNTATTNEAANTNTGALPIIPAVPVTETDAPTETGTLLYVSDGDLWRSTLAGTSKLKLIDADTMSGGQYSQDHSKIAYAKKVSAEKEIPDGIDDPQYKVGQKYAFDEYSLFVANPLGQNSQRVYEAVDRWGWVPNTDLLWYESASLQQVFDVGVYGDGDLYLVDRDGGSAQRIIDADANWDLLNITWDPKGKYIAYIRSNYPELAIFVYDREKKQETKMLDLPYMGGDRGGSPPVPALVWNDDGSALYTAFTTLGLTEEQKARGLDKRYTLGYFTAWRMNLENGTLTKLVASPSCFVTDEVHPGALFSKDFTKVIYPRLNAADVEELKANAADYWNCNVGQSTTYVLRDLAQETDTELLPASLFADNVVWPQKHPVRFAADKMMYFLARQGINLMVIGYNLSNRTRTDTVIDEPVETNTAPGVRSFALTSEKNDLVFLINNNVYVVEEPQAETGTYTVYRVLENVSSVQYYE